LNSIRFLSAQLSSLLKSSTAFWCIHHSSQFGVISKLTESTF